MKLNFPLLALSVGAFGIGTTEFAPMGLLPVIASDLHVSIPHAGLLVSGYALGVLVGAPLLTLTTGGLRPQDRADRPDGAVHGRQCAFRDCSGLWHPAGGADRHLFLPRRLLRRRLGRSRKPGRARRAASAVATMFMGLTIANIGGVPLATLVGQHAGWRAAFARHCRLGVHRDARAAARPAQRSRHRSSRMGPKAFAVLRRPAVLIALATTVLGSAAMFTVFTYIAPILTDVTKVSPRFVTVALVIYGIGLTVGNYLGGRFADIALRKTLIVTAGGARRAAAAVRRDHARSRPGARDDLRVGRCDLRARASASGAGDEGRKRSGEPRIRDQYRRVQPRQRPRRGARAAR